jgi:type I restriction enzyme S subunit
MAFESADYTERLALPVGWRSVPLSQCIERIIDYRGKTPPKAPFGIPCLTAANVKSGRVDLTGVSYISQATYSQVTTRGLPKPGDVLLTTEAPVGEVAEFPGDRRYHITRRIIAIRADERQLVGKFLLYTLQGGPIRRLLRSRIRGSTVERILKEDITRLPLALPPLSEQRAIAHILGTLDDKIELNRRMNETLEAMARALFKSWFVDFDPVRAKAEGRQPPGMDPATAALFPRALQDSALGPMPRGWSLCRLGDVMELKRGYDLPTAGRKPGPVPIVSSSGLSGWHDEVKAPGPGIVTGRYGTIGQVFLVREDFWPLNTTLYLRDFKGNDLLYCYHLLRLVDFSKYSDKAAVPGVNRNHLHEEPVVAAPVEVQECFAKIASSWLDLAAQNTAQVTTLAALRDALLPRLLSGELSVGKAMKAVEATA